MIFEVFKGFWFSLVCVKNLGEDVFILIFLWILGFNDNSIFEGLNDVGIWVGLGNFRLRYWFDDMLILESLCKNG